MAANITLKVDKKTVSKGDSFNISWTSELPDSLVLTIEDGDSVQHIQVPDSGSKICWSNRATKNIDITLTASTGSKKESIGTKVRVHGARKKNQPHATAGISKFQLWKEKVQAQFCVARAQFQSAWAAMKGWQKALWTAAWILPFVLLIIAIVR